MTQLPQVDDKLRTYHVLVVDDDPRTLKHVHRTLVDAGLTVHKADSGEAGLAFMETTPVHVVISDQRMGGMSGTEFLREVKRRYPDDTVLTMILSAFSDVDTLMRAVNDAGAYQYLTKPWEDHQLVSSVLQALRLVDAQIELKHMAEAKEWMLRRMSQVENFSMLGGFGTFLHKRFSRLAAMWKSQMPALVEEARADGGEAYAYAVRMQEDANLLAMVLHRLDVIGNTFRPRELHNGFRKMSPLPILRRKVEEAEAAARAHRAEVSWEIQLEQVSELAELWIHEDAFAWAVHHLLENAMVYNRGRVPQGEPRKVHVRTGVSSQRMLHNTGTRTIEHKPPPVMEEDTLWVEVHDNGPGMQSFGEDTMFELFGSEADLYVAAEANNEALTPFSGGFNLNPALHVGMGLPIALWCVTAHDGNLRLLNPKRPGACFRIDIPLRQTQLVHRWNLR